MDDLEALSEMLTKLSEEPYNLATHIQHIKLAASAGEDQANEAREMFTAYWAARDEVWSPLIDAKKRSSNIDSVSGAQEVHELYEKAEGDYLSIPLLTSHAQFLVERHAHFATTTNRGVVDSADAFSTPWTRMMLKSVMTRAMKDISKSNEVWIIIRDWEMEMLESASPEQRALLVEEIDDLHQTRLKQIHAASDETLQSYSTFTSGHRSPAEYENILVQASKQRAFAVKGYGFRESYESSLAQAGYSLDAYAQYLAYERRAKKPDFVIMSGIYERAILEAAKRRFAGEYGAEEFLRAFWAGYADALRIHQDDEENQLLVYQRAVRSVPGYGEIWSKYIRFAEANPALIAVAHAEDAEAIYNRAFATKLFGKDPEEIVPVVLARAGYEKRMLLSDQGDAETRLGNLLTVLEDGLHRVREASKTGDPRFRIERFFVELHKFTDNTAEAAEVWGAAARHHKTNYTPWIAYAETLMLSNDFHGADAALSKASTAPHMDWPEAIWEAWIALHHSHGTLDSLNKCLDTIDWERQKVNAKRARAAEKAAQEAAQYHQVAEPAKDVIMSDSSMQNASTAEMAMEVDQRPAAQSLKRKAEYSLGADDAKKTKSDAPLKRDRENSTVFVRELPVGTTEEQLNKLFKDCGGIREIRLTTLPNSLVATVEFVDSSSVPAALTKDKKRIDGVEVAVHLAWQSTLYVTNFPESIDDAAIRETFGKYGELFDVRWPSKKYKNTRRFCYVQYTSPSAAKEALMMHGIELESGMPLSVYISNPERKKERTDANANAKEIYVAGLSKFTTKEDLDKRFKAYGSIKDIRIPLDDQGRSKGFAFIEFETEADAVKALGTNNEDLKGRRIAVTIADARVRSAKKEPDSGLGRRADAATRSLRVHSLPQTTHDASTTEGLLQQAFEKHAPVKRLEVFVDKREAIVEFESAADAAKILLQTDAVTLEGQPLKLSDNLSSSSTRATPTAFVPRKAAAPKPRAGLGSRKVASSVTPKPVESGSTQAEASRPAAGKGQDEFRKMLLGGK